MREAILWYRFFCIFIIKIILGKIIHIFDMDGTIVNNPNANDLINVVDGKVNSGDDTIDKPFEKILNYINTVINSINYVSFDNKRLIGLKNNVYFKKENDNVYLYKNNKKATEDLLKAIEKTNELTIKEKAFILKRLIIKNGNVVIGEFPEFYRTEMTVGDDIKTEIFEVYKTVQNKMILTGRSISIKKGVSYILFNVLGLKHPNYGIFFYDGRKGGIKQFKLEIIEKTIKENRWSEVHFYEDRGDWLNYVSENVKKQFPEIKFIKHFVF